MSSPNILIIQTAFIGDVILALPVAQWLKNEYPEAAIHFLVRKGNETLLQQHPSIDNVWIWTKEEKKKRSLYSLIRKLRTTKWDMAINLHRFFSSGLIMSMLTADRTIGFDKNPLSYFYDDVLPHRIPHQQNGQHWHEVERNLNLLSPLSEEKIPLVRPKLYPSEEDQQKVASAQNGTYLTIAPTSVWHTKQWPAEKWVSLIDQLPAVLPVHLVGGPDDHAFCESLTPHHSNITNWCGSLSLLQSAALIDEAAALVTNDSAPLHLASSVNTPTVAVFCSTIPEFGFGPLADNSVVIEHEEDLYCRPCGLHGHATCPEEHFRCALEIESQQVLREIQNRI